jgi:glutathione peroxidase
LYKYLEKEKSEDKIEWLKNKTIMDWVKKISSTCKEPGDILWNFTKFLVNKGGEVIERYSPTFNPMDMENDIEWLLN